MAGRALVASVVGGVVPVGVVASIAAAGILWGGTQRPSFALDGLPEATVHNYQFVASHPQLVEHIPCYCGCYAFGHGSLLDCFVRREGGYERHASDCGICGMEADSVETALAQGSDSHAIRTAIDVAYARYGKPTNTPGGSGN